MTNLKNAAWMAQMTPDQIAFMDSLPSWLTAFWALGVWGALLASILLLMRKRYAVLAYGISLIGAVVGLGYQMVIATMPASMKAGMMGMMPIFIILVALGLFLYARAMEKKGVLN
jgi:CHASE2 domain-containing sensor protein